MMASNGLLPVQAGIELLTPADDAPLTSRMIDELSNRLGNDWKNFARGTEHFTDNQIENIDADQQRVYEKTHRMIKQWQERSRANVTIAMAKLNLISLGRNDLLKDIFNTVTVMHQKESTSSSRGPASLDGITLPNVGDLQYKHVKRLCNFLDTDHGIGVHNWQQLGTAVFQGDRDACDQIESLHLSYSGGGSPAKGFLKSLSMRYPTFTVNQFRDIAIKHQRKDISTYIDSLNCPPGKHFRDLSFSQQDRIARDLDKDIRGISDWRMFADAVGFTNDEIAEFKLAIKELNQYSPTQSLIDMMKQRYPLLSLTKVKTAASNIGRNDIAQYLGTVIEEIAKSK